MLTVTIRDTVLPVESIEEASAEYCRLRDASGEGSSTFRYGFISGAGLGVYVSYNGRVWNQAGACLYDPIAGKGLLLPPHFRLGVHRKTEHPSSATSLS